MQNAFLNLILIIINFDLNARSTAMEYSKKLFNLINFQLIFYSKKFTSFHNIITYIIYYIYYNEKYIIIIILKKKIK